MLKRITGKVQHYAWGGYNYIPQLLNIKNEQHQPFAEYWLGAHPKAPSEITENSGEKYTLNHLIAQNPASYLGAETTAQFGKLPYLFKVLDVHDMLSIQVHPSKEEAEKGFALENEAGISQDAPHRNYKDDNHKPEMMVALSEFYLLHGFLETEKLRQQLEKTPELNPLLPVFLEGGYEALYKKVMAMPQAKVNQMLTPLLNRIIVLYKENRLSKTQPDFWAARALDSGMATLEKIDRGLFSIYFFNLLHLSPGEGIFQAAGLPHAYLEGQNIELMANSDNVLRGGLTPKHVDVPELLKHIVFEGIKPDIIRQKPDNQHISYPCPVPDFTLDQFRLNTGEEANFTANSVEIALLIKGKAVFKGSEKIALQKGESLLATAGEKVKIKAMEDTIIFKAGIPKS